MKVISLGLSILLVCNLPVESAQAPLPVPKPQIEIAVLEGEGAINDVRSRRAHPIAVQVRDGNRTPFAGAVVVFTLPAQGASAEFVNGARSVTITADDQGRAVARPVRLNSVPGKMEILVSASHQGQTAQATVTQFNMMVEQAKGGAGKWIALLAIAGGAAAGGAVALNRRGQSAPAAAAPAVTPIGITPGSSTVGPPR